VGDDEGGAAAAMAGSGSREIFLLGGHDEEDVAAVVAARQTAPGWHGIWKPEGEWSREARFISLFEFRILVRTSGMGSKC